MRRLAEISLFVPVAAGLHLAAFGLAGDGAPGGGGTGAGGDSVVTLAAAAPQVQALVAEWQTPPAAAVAPAAPLAPVSELAPVLDAPAPDRAPRAEPMPLSPPQPDLPPAVATASATPTPPTAQSSQPAPAPRPPKPAIAAQRAAGTGSGAVAGQAGSVSEPGRQKALSASWAAQIQAKVARAHRVPREAVRAGLSGDALVRIVVGHDGRLRAATLVRGSGHAVLDRAALASIKRAGRFPAAPDGLARDSLSFDVPLFFTVK